MGPLLRDEMQKEMASQNDVSSRSDSEDSGRKRKRQEVEEFIHIVVIYMDGADSRAYLIPSTEPLLLSETWEQMESQNGTCYNEMLFHGKKTTDNEERFRGFMKGFEKYAIELTRVRATHSRGLSPEENQVIKNSFLFWDY